MMYLPHQRHSSIMRDRESLNQKEPWPFSFALRPFCSAKPAVVGRYLQYIVTRTAKPRMARKLVDGKYVKYMLYPKLGEKARNNGHVVYSLDFEVTPHQLRHTYITNLIHSSVDPKTVQYLAGHESSKITMDIYAKVKYNRPDDLVKAMGCAFDLWDAV